MQCAFAFYARTRSKRIMVVHPPMQHTILHSAQTFFLHRWTLALPSAQYIFLIAIQILLCGFLVSLTWVPYSCLPMIRMPYSVLLCARCIRNMPIPYNVVQQANHNRFAYCGTVDSLCAKTYGRGRLVHQVCPHRTCTCCCVLWLTSCHSCIPIDTLMMTVIMVNAFGVEVALQYWLVTTRVWLFVRWLSHLSEAHFWARGTDKMFKNTF